MGRRGVKSNERNDAVRRLTCGVEDHGVRHGEGTVTSRIIRGKRDSGVDGEPVEVGNQFRWRELVSICVTPHVNVGIQSWTRRKLEPSLNVALDRPQSLQIETRSRQANRILAKNPRHPGGSKAATTCRISSGTGVDFAFGPYASTPTTVSLASARCTSPRSILASKV